MIYTDAIFPAREVARECDMRNRMIEPDAMFVDAVNEACSTLGQPTWADGAARSVMDILRDQAGYVFCVPGCSLCESYQRRVRAQFGTRASTCVGCNFCAESNT